MDGSGEGGRLNRTGLQIIVVQKRLPYGRFVEVRWNGKVIATVWPDRYTLTDHWPKATDDEPLPEVLQSWGEVLVRAREKLLR